MAAHYLDHAASTPPHPAVVAAMTEVIESSFANPSGAHRMAREANRRLDAARAAVAGAFGWTPGNIVFTSGGTEADNLAVNASLALAARRGTPDPLAICSAVEHHAVLEPVEHSGGAFIAARSDGTVSLDHLEELLVDADRSGRMVGIVSVMAANNETGVVQPVAEVARVVRRLAPQAILHTDAVQYAAWEDTRDLAATVDLMSVSAHKFGGPKGAGFLAVADSVDLPAAQLGGGQERDRRGGTQNVSGIIGLASAAEVTVADRAGNNVRVGALRDRLERGIVDGVPDVHVTGATARRLPNISHLCLAGVESEALLFLLEKDDVMASAASSCASGAQQASHVLAAMGVPSELARGSVRLSLGPASTDADVDAAVEAVVAAVNRIRRRG